MCHIVLLVRACVALRSATKLLQLPGIGERDDSASRWNAQVQRAAAMSGDLTKPEDVVPFIVFLATDGAPSFELYLST